MSMDVRQLIRDLIPTAPDLGLFVTPDVPADRVNAAIEDYATSMSFDEVLALYDATYNRSGKDGAVFTADRMIFQNHDWAPVHEVRYEDIVQVTSKKRFIGGRKVHVDVNRGRATVTFVIDFSGKPGAAEFVARFLQEVMMVTIASDTEVSEAQAVTDPDAVRRALNQLQEEGKLAKSDLAAMMSVIMG